MSTALFLKCEQQAKQQLQWAAGHRPGASFAGFQVAMSQLIEHMLLNLV